MEFKLDDLIPVFDTEDNVPTIDEAIEDIDSDVIEDETKEDEEVIEDETPEPSAAATLFYKELAANGIGKDEKEEYTYDDINGLINEYTQVLPEKITQEIIQSTPEIGQKAIDYIFTKGQNLTKEDLKEFVTTYLEDISSSDLSIDTDESAREVLEKEYTKQGFKPSVVEVMLDTLEDEGELQNEAKKLVDTKPKKADQILTQSKEEVAQFKEQQRTFVNSINTEFDQLKWDKRKVNQLKTDLFAGKTSEVLSKASKNPKALIQLTDFASYWDEKTESFNFDKFIEKLNSKETKSLKDKIEQDMFSSTPRTKSAKANISSKFDDLVPIVNY